MQAQAFINQLEPHTSFLNALGVTAHQSERLCSYLERLWAANQNLNLFSRKLSPEQLVVDHLLDCLAALPNFPENGTIADLGSGGGLPGVVLAICRPQTQVMLFEKSPKKRQFLASLSDLCPNIDIQGLVDPALFPRHIAIVTARAFKPISVILELTQPHALSGKPYLLYKGRQARIDEELRQANLKKLRVQVHPLPIIGEADERHLVELRA